MYDVGPILCELPEPFTLPQALGAGLTARVLRRLVRNGDVVRTTRGVFRRGQSGERAGARWEQIREAIRAMH